jgi:capsular polysaccharide biosynthesis protein/MinD-like ATPase involved in chromosome partitioning or flagellar assembly
VVEELVNLEGNGAMHVQDTLRYYAQVIRKQFIFIFLGIIFGSTGTFIISLFLPPVYQASALVNVNSVLASPTSTSGNDIFSAQAQAVSYAILVTSPEVLQAALTKLPGMTVDQLKSAVSDSPVDNTQLIEIRASANRPQEAANIANIVATTFVQFQETQEKTRLQNIADKLAQNLAQVKVAINTAQQQLTTLQNIHATADSIAQQQGLLATYQSTYTSLLSSNDQLQTEEQQTANILSVAQSAVPPSKPTNPQLVLNTMLGASISLLVMIVLVLLHDWLDVTIQTVDDVIRLAELEPLGSIPLGVSSSQLCDLTSERTYEVKEAYSLLGISFRVLRQGQRTILLTSPRSAAGTTTAATYLALSLAKTGLRVLLVDANLHHPALHDIFLRPNTLGLVESLQNIHAFQEPSTSLPHLWLNQWKTDIPNLWLLPAGSPESYLTSPLNEPALGLLLERLLGAPIKTSEQLQPALVDLVIFDAASLEDGTDAYLLTAVADATVLIIEAGKEHKGTLQRLSVTFQQFGAPILGVIVNRQQKRHRSYFYVPRQASSESKAVVSPSLDSAPPSLLRQENNSRVPEQVIDGEMQRLSAEEPLPSECMRGKAGDNSSEMKGQFKLKRQKLLQKHFLSLRAMPEPMHEKDMEVSSDIEKLVTFELPETPAPLPLMLSDTVASVSTEETQDDPPGRLQFAPLLRVRQGSRISGKVSES